MNETPKRLEIHNIVGNVKSTSKSVVLLLDVSGAELELHFSDPDQLMLLCVGIIENMSKVFPEHEAAQLWLDDSF